MAGSTCKESWIFIIIDTFIHLICFVSLVCAFTVQAHVQVVHASMSLCEYVFKTTVYVHDALPQYVFICNLEKVCSEREAYVREGSALRIF